MVVTDLCSLIFLRVFIFNFTLRLFWYNWVGVFALCFTNDFVNLVLIDLLIKVFMVIFKLIFIFWLKIFVKIFVFGVFGVFGVFVFVVF